MLKNYFIISVRNILKRKLFAGINILGMTIGIAACLFISLYVINEFSYDRFHTNADRIYQVGLHKKFGASDVYSASTCPPLADALKTDIPEVESAIRLTGGGKQVLRYGENTVIEDGIVFTEGNFFEFFSFKLLAGNPKTALTEPSTIVLTETVARRLFGDENPLDKLITLDEGIGKIAYKVTGVATDCPGNSHFKFKVLASFGEDNYFKLNAWLNSGVYTYFTLKENTSVNDVNKKMEGIVQKYVASDLQKFIGSSLDQLRKADGDYKYYSTKITDIHLRSTSQDDLQPGGSLTYIYALIGVGIFILIIACINFMNMSTAQSARRGKEVGLRKTLGSLRSQMAWQFLAESMLYSLVAITLAVVLCYLLLPAFKMLSGKELSMIDLLDIRFIGVVGIMLLIVGLLAGSYPAFYLTSFKPAEVLKGKINSGLKSKGIRSTLVVFQFAISIFLIIFTSVVYAQIEFMQEMQMGMDKQNVLVIEDVYKLDSKGEAFRDALAQQTGVKKVSFTGNKFPGTYNSFLMRSASTNAEHSVASYSADSYSQDVLKFEMKDGRYFSKDIRSDSNAIVINEAAAKAFGFDKAEGQDILHSPNAFKFIPYHVIGIMKDFSFESYRDKVRPLAIFYYGGNSGLLMVRYEGNAKTVIDNTSKLWKEYASTEPFVYSFLDENFDKQYRSEERTSQVLSVFASLAIFIACLGLFALAAFTAEQRTKEIGIRKVMGASVASLSIMLTREFIALVIIAFVPAAALSWWTSSQWLNGFAYRVEINPFIFVIACVSAIAIAWLTVGYQSVKAANANPADSLRHE